MKDTDDVTPINGVDIDAIVDGAQRVRRSMPLCLRGDLVAEYEELERQRDEAEKAAEQTDLGDSLASTKPTAAIDARMDGLRAEMLAGTITVVMQSMPRKEYNKLVKQHPPRRDEDGAIYAEDRALDINMETFWEPLIRACWVSPVLTKARMTRILDEIVSDQQYSELADLAMKVNRGKVDVPFLSRA